MILKIITTLLIILLLFSDIKLIKKQIKVYYESLLKKK